MPQGWKAPLELKRPPSPPHSQDHPRTDPYRSRPMGDGTEIQATPAVNGTKENIKNSTADAIILRILSGEQTVISHGASQYQVGGVSACGLAALNCTRLVLAAEQDGPKGKDLLRYVTKAKTAQEITSICAQWTSSSHLEVEDIYKVPLFSRSLKLERSEFGLPSFEKFRSVLSRLVSTGEKSAAIVITRPPEIITCVKISIPDDPDVFMIFDSHSRPNHPDGAGFTFSTSIDAIANYLDNLLAIDQSILSDHSLQWQTQLLANFSGLLFVARTTRFDSNPFEAERAVIESSLAILALQAEVADLKSQNAALQGDLRTAELRVEEALEYSFRPTNPPKPSRKSSEPVWLPAPTKKKNRKKKGDNRSSNPPDYRPSPPAPIIYYSGEPQVDTEWPPLVSPKYERQAESSVPPKSRSPSPSQALSPPPVLDDDILILAGLQKEFDDEDSRLRSEREALASTQLSTFTCAVCTDEFSEEFVARVPDCGHGFCRECLKMYAVSKLEEHRFPLLCPSCVADNTGKEPGTITSSLIAEVGISQDYFVIFEELQLSCFSILIHCRRCKRSMFVDRSEYQHSRTVACPLPDCNYAWCRSCQRPIDFGGPQHSCDGSSELRSLMKEKGWKHCPGCNTPIQKDSGCHHMTCMAPGCNTHFCYVCGELIVKSALRKEIQDAVSSHYRRCRLFEDIPTRRRR